MRILYFHQYFSTTEGSVGTRSYEFSKYLVLAGHEVTVVCGQYDIAVTGLTGVFYGGRREGIVDGIRVIEYAFPYSNSDSFFKRILTFLRFSISSIRESFRQDYEILFATSTPLTAAIPGIVIKVLGIKKKFVFEVRDLWPELPHAMGVINNPVILFGMSLLEWMGYHMADLCIGLAPGICEGIIRRGIEPSRVILIPNGCDLSLFSDDFEDKSIFGTPAINNETFVAFFCGAHGIANGLDAILDAALVLKKRGAEQIRIVLVGEGREKRRLKERAISEGLGNILFLNSVPKAAMTKMLKAADVGLMLLKNVPAFYYGTSPNKFFDYLASGLPVLNNYPGWVADLISSNQCGEVVPPDNAEELADSLIKLSMNRERTRQLGQNALALARKSFSRLDLAQKFEEALQTALS
jgi:glycosyltransferase involved in cell wall biosynthesis